MAGLAAAAAFALLLADTSGAKADTPVPVPAVAAGTGGAAHLAPPIAGKPKSQQNATPLVTYVLISATPANEPVFGEIPLLAQTDQDVGPTPFYIMIVDDSTGDVVKTCGTGTQCGTFVGMATAVTKNYTAYVGDYATTVGAIQNIQAVSQPQTVSWFHVCG